MKNETTLNKRANCSWDLVNFCEFDKYAAKAYCAIHDEDESKNLGDITKVDLESLPRYTMITGSSPCQDLSVAGHQEGTMWECKDCGHKYNPLFVHWSERNVCPHCGSENLEGTRSSLLANLMDIIRATKPKFGVYENVKNLVGKKFKDGFDAFLGELDEYGYNTYYKVLNTKNYGVPQNRERVFLIYIRKDCDNGKFVWPEPFDNGLRLKDMLEDEVDDKYYVKTDRAKALIKDLVSSGRLEKEFSNSIRTGGHGSVDRHQWDTVTEVKSEQV